MSADASDAAILPGAASHLFVSRGVTYRALEWGKRPHGGGATGARVPLLLLHGFAQSAVSWGEIAAQLARERFVAALDVVGHGESDAPGCADAYTFDAACAAIDAYADETLPGTFALLGYSMGGRIALAYACGVPQVARVGERGLAPDAPCARRAARLAALVLESAGLGPADSSARAAACARDEELAHRLDCATPEKFADYWEALPLFASQRALPEPARERLRAGRLDNDPRALARVVRGMGQHRMACFSENESCLQRLAAPVLYIAGILDEKYATIAETIQNGGSASRALLDTGHNTHFEDPAAFSRLVGEFLRSVDNA